MMDFDGVEKIRQRVQLNATLFEQVQQLSAVIAQIAPEIAAKMGIIPGAVGVANNQPTGAGVSEAPKGSLSKQAAAATAASTEVRS
jgi:hypothetical protein